VRLLDPMRTITVLEKCGNANSDGLGELRKKIGFLFQSGALYDSMTVRENLEFPCENQEKSYTGAKGCKSRSLDHVALRGYR